MGRNISQSTAVTSAENPNPTKVFGQGNIQTFYTTGTFTTPTYARAIKVRVWGAGGSGAFSGTNGNTYSGGAGGGYSEKIVVNPTSTYTVTVGTGGLSLRNTGNTQLAGNAGGTSSFGSVCSSTGGGGGSITGAAATGGTGSSGDFNYTGGSSGATSSAGSNSFSGGGSAAGYWGNGFASGAITNSSITQSATGGAGIGGSSGTIANSTNFTTTGGGGSMGPSGSIVNFSNLQETISGPGASGYVAFPRRISSISATSGSAITFEHIFYGQSGVSDSDVVHPIRYPGDALPTAGGAGGGTITREQAVSIYAGNGGYGAGGGAVSANNWSTTAQAGKGGAFGGGGGGAGTASSGYPGGGGDGGYAAGGGAGGMIQSGAGGNGIVVVEW